MRLSECSSILSGRLYSSAHLLTYFELTKSEWRQSFMLFVYPLSLLLLNMAGLSCTKHLSFKENLDALALVQQLKPGSFRGIFVYCSAGSITIGIWHWSFRIWHSRAKECKLGYSACRMFTLRGPHYLLNFNGERDFVRLKRLRMSASNTGFIFHTLPTISYAFCSSTGTASLLPIIL